MLPTVRRELLIPPRPQGGCEHLVTFLDVRLHDPGADPPLLSHYPYKLASQHQTTRSCEARGGMAARQGWLAGWPFPRDRISCKAARGRGPSGGSMQRCPPFTHPTPSYLHLTRRFVPSAPPST